MDTYELTYCYDDDWAGTVTEIAHYTGTWDGLQDYIVQLKDCGCYWIDASCITDNY